MRHSLPLAPPELGERSREFLQRLDAFDARAKQIGAYPNDIGIPLSLGRGAVFVMREALILLVGGPVALWGYVNHWAPLRLSRLVASRLSRNPDEPAMNRLVSGFVLVLAWYALVGGVIGATIGPWFALAYLLTALPAADWDFRLRDRLARAYSRARTYVRLRSDAAMRGLLLNELAFLRTEAQRLRADFERLDHEVRVRDA
jgi:hypothetical protein